MEAVGFLRFGNIKKGRADPCGGGGRGKELSPRSGRKNVEFQKKRKAEHQLGIIPWGESKEGGGEGVEREENLGGTYSVYTRCTPEEDKSWTNSPGEKWLKGWP